MLMTQDVCKQLDQLKILRNYNLMFLSQAVHLTYSLAITIYSSLFLLKITPTDHPLSTEILSIVYKRPVVDITF